MSGLVRLGTTRTCSRIGVRLVALCSLAWPVPGYADPQREVKAMPSAPVSASPPRGAPHVAHIADSLGSVADLHRVAAKGSAEFSIDSTGQVTRNEQPDDARTIGFFDGPGDSDLPPAGGLYVMVYADSTRHPKGNTAQLVQEGWLARDQRVQLPTELPSETDVWRIEVHTFGPVDRSGILSDAIYLKSKPTGPAEQTAEENDPIKAVAAVAASAKAAADDEQYPAKAAADAAEKANSAADDSVNEAAIAYVIKDGGDLAGAQKHFEKAASSALKAVDQGKRANQAAKLTTYRLQVSTTGTPEYAAAKSDEDAAARSARAANQDAGRAKRAVWPDGACYSLFGMFELPATKPDHTIELPLSSQSTSTSSSPTIHRESVITAWATRVSVKDGPVFSWRIIGNTAADLPTVLAQVFADIGGPKASLQSLVRLGSPPTLPNNEGPPPFCAIPDSQLALYRSVAQTSKALSGALVAGRVYTVTASVGNGSSKNDGTWTVTGAPGAYEVKGPKLQGTSSSSGSGDTTPNPNKAQAQFNSPPGWGWTLITGIAWDTDLETFNASSNGQVFASSSGAFPSYQWRPTANTGAAQEVYVLDNAFQPLQRIAFPILVAGLFPEVGSGRWGIGAGPTLLWGSGTNGTAQEWLLDGLWSPPWWDSTLDKLYVTAGVGFRFVPALIGDQAGETVSVPRTNGSAPVPAGPTTRTRAAPVFSIGLGFDLALIGKAVSTITGASSSSGGK
jgi:hypothetical protein